MTSRKIKAAGVLVLMLAFVVTMSACDMGSDDEALDVGETGELIVSADMSEMDTDVLEAQVEEEVGTQSTVKERFENYTVRVNLDGPEDPEETEDVDYDDLKNGEEIAFEFEELAPGAYDVEVYLEADYQYELEGDADDIEVSYGSEDGVTVYEGESTHLTDDDAIDVYLNDGALQVSTEIEDIDTDKLDLVELREFGTEDPVDDNGDYTEDKWGGEVITWGNYEDGERQEDDLAPRQYEIYSEWEDSSGETHEQERSVHVVPGLERNINLVFYEGELQFEFDFEMPSETPYNLEIEYDTLTWEHDDHDNINKYNIVRKNLDAPEDDQYWEVVATSKDKEYEIDHEVLQDGVTYEYAVVAEDDDLTSDYSDPVEVVGGEVNVDDEGDLEDALTQDDISTITVADGVEIENGVEIARDGVTLQAENKHKAEIDAQVTIAGNDVSLQKFKIKPEVEFGAGGGESAIQVTGNGALISENLFEGPGDLEDTDYTDGVGIGISGSGGAKIIENDFEEYFFGIRDESNENLIKDNNFEDTTVGYNSFKGDGRGDHKIENNKFISNGVGIVLASSENEITGNEFEENDMHFGDYTGEYDVVEILAKNEFSQAAALDDMDHEVYEKMIHPSIKSSVNNANEGAKVTVEAGDYEEDLTVDVEGLTLKSVEKHGAVIEGQVDIEADDVTVDGFEVEADVGHQEEVIEGEAGIDFELVNSRVIAISDEDPGRVIYIKGGYSDTHNLNNPSQVTLRNNTFVGNNLNSGVGVGIEIDEATIENNQFNIDSDYAALEIFTDGEDDTTFNIDDDNTFDVTGDGEEILIGDEDYDTDDLPINQDEHF